MVRGISDYGREIKMRLLAMDKTQNWLVEQVREKTGRYFDDSYLHKIFVGKEKSPVILAAINETLDIDL